MSDYLMRAAKIYCEHEGLDIDENLMAVVEELRDMDLKMSCLRKAADTKILKDR